MAHLVELTDLVGFTAESTLCAAFSKGQNKQLLIQNTVMSTEYLSSCYVVYNQKVMVLKTNSLQEAIEEYNKY